MATVISKTSVKIDDLLSDVLVEAEIVDGSLYVTTRSGAVTNVGIVGGSGGANYRHEQTFVIAANTWTIVHNQSTKAITVETRNNLDQEIIGDVSYPDLNTIQVDFYYPQTGLARLWY